MMTRHKARLSLLLPLIWAICWNSNYREGNVDSIIASIGGVYGFSPFDFRRNQSPFWNSWNIVNDNASLIPRAFITNKRTASSKRREIQMSKKEKSASATTPASNTKPLEDSVDSNAVIPGTDDFIQFTETAAEEIKKTSAPTTNAALDFAVGFVKEGLDNITASNKENISGDGGG